MQATPSSFKTLSEGAGVAAVVRPAARAGSGASPCRARPRQTTATCKFAVTLTCHFHCNKVVLMPSCSQAMQLACFCTSVHMSQSACSYAEGCDNKDLNEVHKTGCNVSVRVPLTLAGKRDGVPTECSSTQL